MAHPGAEETSAEVTESPDRVANRDEVEELVLSPGFVRGVCSSSDGDFSALALSMQPVMKATIPKIT